MERTITVRCIYSEDGEDIAEMIQASFHLFLQKELFMPTIEPRMPSDRNDR